MKILPLSFFILWASVAFSAPEKNSQLFLFGHERTKVVASANFTAELAKTTKENWEILGDEAATGATAAIPAGSLKVVLLDPDMISRGFFEALKREGKSLSTGDVVKMWWQVKFERRLFVTRRKILQKSFRDLMPLVNEKDTLIVWRDGRWSANFPPSEESSFRKNIKRALLPSYFMNPLFLQKEMKKIFPNLVIIKADSQEEFESLLASAIRDQKAKSP